MCSSFLSFFLELLTTDSAAGSYTVQIWWKGDPGVENFVIKFQNEEMMKKWATGLDTQRKENVPQITSSPDQPTANFRWMEAQPDLVNPYAEPDEDEEDNTPPSTSYSNAPATSMPGTMPRTASSTSLRQRGDSNASLAGMVRRQAPPSFPMPAAPQQLSLQTTSGQQSPGSRLADSYFSPVAESPASSRTSQTSSFFGQGAGYVLPKPGHPSSGWLEDNNRYTAPAMPRAPSRDGPSPVNAYGMVNGGRNPRGPSLPAMSSTQSLAQQQRSRSYSTPDINGQPQQPVRRTERGGSQGVPAVPGIPPHLQTLYDGGIPRGQTGSPRSTDLPIRANTQSPGVQRERLQSQGYGGQMSQFPTQPINRSNTPGANGQGMMPAPLNLDPSRIVPPGLNTAGATPTSNPLASPNPNDMPFQSQLKVKVNCDSGNYVTLVAAFNITYQSLTDRIDAKLARFTSSSIGKGNLRLRYRDEDGDFVNIESDEDIQIAFSDWRENIRSMYSGGMGEIELYCVGDMASA